MVQKHTCDPGITFGAFGLFPKVIINKFPFGRGDNWIQLYTLTAGLIHDHLQAFLFSERKLAFLFESSKQGAEREYPWQNKTLSPSQIWDLSAVFPMDVFQSPPYSICWLLEAPKFAHGVHGLRWVLWVCWCSEIMCTFWSYAQSKCLFL